jgi:hypothetical protein
MMKLVRISITNVELVFPLALVLAELPTLIESLLEERFVHPRKAIVRTIKAIRASQRCPYVVSKINSRIAVGSMTLLL